MPFASACPHEVNPPDEITLYDEFVRTYQAHVYPLLATEILRRTGIRTGTCLEVGAGAGYLSIALTREVPLTGWVTDLAPPMVGLAGQRIAEAGLAHRLYVGCADVHRLPFSDSTFDLVVSHASLHHWADPRTAFREIVRVLRPHGQAVVVDTERHSPLSALHKAIAARIPDERLRRWFLEGISESYQRQEIAEFLAPLPQCSFEVFPLEFAESTVMEHLELVTADHLAVDVDGPPLCVWVHLSIHS